MRLNFQRFTRPAVILRITTFIAILGATTLVPMLTPISSRAVTDCSPNSVRYAGTGWLGGLGVNVCNHPGDDSNNYVQNVSGVSTFTGTKWQCVEMVNRLYLIRGWTTAFWQGNGNTLVNHVPAGLTKQNNSSISYINPGDVITLDKLNTAGHAAIVNSVVTSGQNTTVNIINQNSMSVDSSAYIESGSFAGGNAFLKMNGSSGYTVQSIIHRPGGGGASGSPARSDVDNNGGADLLAMVSTQSGVAGYLLVSTHQSFLTQYWWDGTGLGWSGVTPMVGDVNGDKKADLVFLTNEAPNGTKAFVALSSGAGFSVPQLWWNGAGMGYTGIKSSMGDVDGNGCEDLTLTTNEATGVKAFVLLSTCQGLLTMQMAWDGVGIGWSGMIPMVGDAADGDKKADYMFVTDEGVSGTKAFVAKSDGAAGIAHFSYTTPQPWQALTGFMYPGIKTTIGDTDGNGCTDLTLTTNEATGVKAFVLLSTCQGLLGPQMWWDGTGVGWSGMTPFTGDTDNDKKADYIFMTDEGVNGIKVFDAHSNGSTGFSYTTPQPWANVPGWAYPGVKTYLR